MKTWNDQNFETATKRVPNNNRNRFDQFDAERDRDDYSSNQPLAKISFGKLPYPSGNEN